MGKYQVGIWTGLACSDMICMVCNRMSVREKNKRGINVMCMPVPIRASSCSRSLFFRIFVHHDSLAQGYSFPHRAVHILKYPNNHQPSTTPSTAPAEDPYRARLPGPCTSHCSRNIRRLFQGQRHYLQCTVS